MPKKVSKSTRVVTPRKSERTQPVKPQRAQPEPQKTSGADILRDGLKTNRFI